MNLTWLWPMTRTGSPATARSMVAAESREWPKTQHHFRLAQTSEKIFCAR